MAAVMAYIGCRNSEALWLTPAGIVEDRDTGIHDFNFSSETAVIDGNDVLLRPVKSEHTVRKVLIHSRLIEWEGLGLVAKC